MKKNPAPSRNAGMSLIQVHDGRQLMLEKMRGKLAGASQFQTESIERRRVTARKSMLGWSWRIGILAVIAAGNIMWMSSRTEMKRMVAPKHAPTLAPPAAALNANEQALYWAYALYDFDKLCSKFNVPKGVVIDSRIAAANLRGLFPKADAQTRFAIERYLPTPKRGGQ